MNLKLSRLHGLSVLKKAFYLGVCRLFENSGLVFIPILKMLYLFSSK